MDMSLGYAKVPKGWESHPIMRVLQREYGLAGRLVAFHLMTSRYANMIVLYVVSLITVAHETHVPLKKVKAIVARCSELGYAHYDHENEVVWVVEGAQMQIAPTLEPNDKRLKNVAKLLTGHNHSPLVSSFVQKYGRAFHLDVVGFVVPDEAPSQAPWEVPSQAPCNGTEQGASEPVAVTTASSSKTEIEHKTPSALQNNAEANDQQTQGGDTRFNPLKDAIKMIIHPRLDLDKADFSVMRSVLRSNPSLTTSELLVCIAARYRTESVNSAEAPRKWLPEIASYLKGPLDRYKRAAIQAPRELTIWQGKALAAMDARIPDNIPRVVFGRPAGGAYHSGQDYSDIEPIAVVGDDDWEQVSQTLN